MSFIFSLWKKKIQISLKSKGVFSPWWDLDSKIKQSFIQGRHSGHLLTVINGCQSREEGRSGTLISFGMQTASLVPCMSSSVAEQWVKVVLVTPVWIMSPYGALTHRSVQWAVRGETTGHFFILKLHFRQKHVFSAFNHTAQHRLKEAGAWKDFWGLLF